MATPPIVRCGSVGGEMGQVVLVLNLTPNVPVTKLANLSWIPQTHMVERKLIPHKLSSELHPHVLWHVCMHTYKALRM